MVVIWRWMRIMMLLVKWMSNCWRIDAEMKSGGQKLASFSLESGGGGFGLRLL